MEKPKPTKGIHQNALPEPNTVWYPNPLPFTPKRCHMISRSPNRQCLSPEQQDTLIPTPLQIKPKRCPILSRSPHNRQAGDTKLQDRKYSKAKNPAQAAMQLKYGRFINQPNFTRPGRQRQKMEVMTTIKRPPGRVNNTKSNGPHFIVPKSEKRLYHHLSLSEVMHIDIKPPNSNRALSPMPWSTPIIKNKYNPTRARTPRKN